MSIKSNKLVLGRGRILEWARETKARKTQSLSSKWLSPSKGGYKELHKKTEQGRTINIRLSPENLEKKMMQKLMCKADTVWYPLWPEQVRTTTPWKCQSRPFRSGSSAEPRGSNTDYFTFLLKPCYLSELLVFLFPTWNPFKPEADLTKKPCTSVVSTWPNVEGNLGKHPINLVSTNCFST